MLKVMPIDSIIVGPRHRKDLGDLQALADSIAKVGLLHPPVINTAKELICGLRRLEALKRLGEDDIEVRVIDVDDLLLAEHDENEVRKAFTVEERVAIAEAIEERIGNRQGQRTDLTEPSDELPQDLAEVGPGEPRHDHAEVEPGNRTADIAAKRAGFRSRESYRKAKQVISNGVPALKDAVNAGEVSIDAAAEVATLPEEEQEEVVAAGPAAAKARAKEVRSSRVAAKNPMERALEDIFALLSSVEAKDDPYRQGWGGVEVWAQAASKPVRTKTKHQLQHVIDKFKGWIVIIKQVEKGNT